MEKLIVIGDHEIPINILFYGVIPIQSIVDSKSRANTRFAPVFFSSSH